jgi:hypothetical protein
MKASVSLDPLSVMQVYHHYGYYHHAWNHDYDRHGYWYR